MKSLKIAALLLALPISSYAASTPEDCTAITSDKYRLKCYDKFFTDPSNKRYIPRKEKIVKDSDSILKTDLFGFENKVIGENSISTQVVGHFSKWKKGMQVPLANGQTWKIIDGSSLYKPSSNAPVTIEKAAFGSFFMSFEGTNKRLRVKRIK